MRLRLGFVLFACVVLAGVCMTGAQARYHHTDVSGYERSQYVNIAPLPGAGIALNAAGELDGLGALQINIPVAYTPGWGYVAGGGFEGAHIGGPSWSFDNGTGVVATAFFGKPSVFISGMKVSHLVDESFALNGQAGLVRDTAKTPAFAVGEQDMLGKEPGGVSPYLVFTKSLSLNRYPVFATLGYGGGRFLDKPFGGLSAPLGTSCNLAVENDGYQFNAGLGFRPGGRNGKLTLLLAHNSKAGWLAGLSVAGSFSLR